MIFVMREFSRPGMPEIVALSSSELVCHVSPNPGEQSRARPSLRSFCITTTKMAFVVASFASAQCAAAVHTGCVPVRTVR